MSESGFETLRVEERYRGFSTVRVETVRTPDGEELEREIVGHQNAVAVVAITADDEVLMLRQYRQPLRRHLLEIPAGKLDVEGEESEAAARRELAEETGFGAAELEHLITFDNSAGWCDERTAVYLAEGATASGRPDGFEAEGEEAEMDLVPMPFSEAVGAALRGELTDAKTVVGLLLAHERR